MKKIQVTWEAVYKWIANCGLDNQDYSIYGVPKGGMILAGLFREATIEIDPGNADFIIDDIIDSGKTRDFYKDRYPKIQFVAMVNKAPGNNDWYSFPWETDHPSGPDSIQDNIIRILEYIGEDPNRDGLKNTPDRMIRSWEEIFSGYNKDPKEELKVFESKPGASQIILLKNIEIFSICEHHFLPFFGKAHIAYIPNANGKVIGISKLVRIANIFSRRLQIQERLGDQIAELISTELGAKGAACIIEADHLCMRMRGVNKQHSSMVTSSLKGVFMDKPEARMELMGLIK